MRIFSLVCLFILPSALIAQTQTIDFEDFAGPSIFDSIQPPLQVLSATFSGGEILANTAFLPADQTTVYGTSFFCDGCLPSITIDFSQKVSNLQLTIINGQTFEVTYTVEDDQGNNEDITLAANFDSGAGDVVLPVQNIRRITISGDASDWDFFIDNVMFEPSGPVLIDPIKASLLRGASITTDAAVLANAGNVIKGAAADGAAKALVRIPANQVGESLTVSVLDDEGRQSNSISTEGGLALPGADVNAGSFQSELTVKSVATPQGPMAFAVYRAPQNFSRGSQDDSKAERHLSIQVQSLDTPQSHSTAEVLLARPPVVLVHGLWDTDGAWNSFSPLVGDSRFFIRRARYSDAVTGITASVPSYDSSKWALVHKNALGFAYNAPSVLSQINNFISDFRDFLNVAAVQADVVGHSMGGDISRTMVLLDDFLSPETYGLGPIHKLITIGTPHLGTPLATQILQSQNKCVRDILAGQGNISLESITFSGGTVNGAVADLEGDGSGGGLSSALAKLPEKQPFPAAYIAGVMSATNLAGLDCGIPCNAALIRADCVTFTFHANPLAQNLTSKNWPNVFGQASDAIVPERSQLNGGTGGPLEFSGVVHSSGVEALSFNGPAELDQGSGIPAKVINLLNEKVDSNNFQ